MEEIEYEVDCPVCETGSKITLVDVEERPAHCPMCGSEIEDDWDEE